MRLVNSERNMLAVSIISMLAIFLSGSTTFVKGYPMMLEVEPEEERVSSMDGEIMLYGVESLSSTKFSDCICVSVCVQLTHTLFDL